MADLLAIEKEGRETFKRGGSADECPYTFNRSPFWASKDADGFHRAWRPMLDAWMNGWIAEQRAFAATPEQVARRAERRRKWMASRTASTRGVK